VQHGCETRYPVLFLHASTSPRTLYGTESALVVRAFTSDFVAHSVHVSLYTQKTGVPVHLVLPSVVLDALKETMRTSTRYWFWSGVGELESAVTNWRWRFQRLFEIAKIPDGHAHRFRDTFAVELLLAGIPIERVSVLLGHQSIRITERHYSPWAQSRQEQLEADLRKAWQSDPLAQTATPERYAAGTDGVQTATSPYFIGGSDGGAGGNRTHA
jgi:Phage integrase family